MCYEVGVFLQDYAPLDPYLDGILRFGGGYSNMLGSNASNAEQRNAVFDEIRNYASAVAAINQKTAGKDTCVFVPPPQQGLGCKYGFNLSLYLRCDVE